MIEIHLLGPPLVEIDGQAVRLPYQKATALLAYLAVTGKPQSRSKLASLLWGDVDNNRAQNSLRNAMFNIRRQFGTTAILQTSQDIVFFPFDQENLDIWLDTAVFRNIIRHDQHIDTLKEALSLWRGPFLEGLNVDGTPDFDNWITTTREQFDRIHRKGWLQLSKTLADAGQLVEATEAAQYLLTLDPLRESGHQFLMRLHLRQGNRIAALQQYEQCRNILSEELGIAPDSETQALHIEALAEESSPRFIREQSAAIGGRRDTPFVGRKRELQLLDTQLQVIQEGGNGRLLLIEGEAGVGKTRLVEEWLTRTPNTHILTGRCFEAEQNVPYHSWIDILRASLSQANWQSFDLADIWLAELARLVPEIHIHWPNLSASPAPDPRLVRGRMAEAVRQWLLALGQNQPICLFLDDLQWIDHASLSLLEYILRHSQGQRLLILGVQRGAETVPDWERTQALLIRENLCTKFRLYRLAFADIVYIAQHLGIQKDEPDTFFKRLFRETEGNPLFVIEILRALDRQDLDPDEEWPIPSSIQGVIRSRLDRLSSDTRRLLAVAAVIGRRFDYDTLQSVTGLEMDIIWSALDEGAVANLIQEENGRYNFTHDKIRAVLYDDLGETRRRHLHGRIAHSLQALPQDRLTAQLGTLVHHFLVAGDSQHARDYALLAAHHAGELYADEDALAEYAHVIELTQVEDLDDDLPLNLAGIVTPTYMKELPVDIPPGVVTLAHCQRGLICQRTGRYQEALTEFNLALAEAQRRQHPDEEALVHNLLSFLSYLQGNYQGVADHAQQAHDMAVALENAHLHATSLKNLGIVAYQQGDYERSLSLYQEALGQYKMVGDRMGMGACYNNIGFVQDAQGNYETAVSSFQQAFTLRKTLGQVEGQAVHLANIGRVYAHQGDISQARQYLAQALALGEEINANWVLAKVHLSQALVAILDKDWETAVSQSQITVKMAKELGNQEDLGVALSLLGEIAANYSLSNLGEPSSYFQQSLELLETAGDQAELERARRRYHQYQNESSPF